MNFFDTVEGRDLLYRNTQAMEKMANETETNNRLLEEQNNLLRELLGKQTASEPKESEAAKAFALEGNIL